MSFSQESIRKLADVTSRDIYDAIAEDGRLEEAIMNALPGAIQKVMGEVSPELVGELGCEVMGRIGIVDDTVWKKRYDALYRHVKRVYAESYIDGAEYSYSYGYEDLV